MVSVQTFRVHPGSPEVVGPIAAILGAALYSSGYMDVTCEVDQALPQIRRSLYVLRDGDPIPSVDRPRTVEARTFDRAERLETGEVDVVHALFACAVAGDPGAFLYQLPDAPE